MVEHAETQVPTTPTSYYLSEVHVHCLWPLPHIVLVCLFSVDPC